jgi:hypothetical protein
MSKPYEVMTRKNILESYVLSMHSSLQERLQIAESLLKNSVSQSGHMTNIAIIDAIWIIFREEVTIQQLAALGDVNGLMHQRGEIGDSVQTKITRIFSFFRAHQASRVRALLERDEANVFEAIRTTLDEGEVTLEVLEQFPKLNIETVENAKPEDRYEILMDMLSRDFSEPKTTQEA